MLDRYDPRDDDGRSRGDSFERHRGSRVGGDRTDVRDDDARSVFGRHRTAPCAVRQVRAQMVEGHAGRERPRYGPATVAPPLPCGVVHAPRVPVR